MSEDSMDDGDDDGMEDGIMDDAGMNDDGMERGCNSISIPSRGK